MSLRTDMKEINDTIPLESKKWKEPLVLLQQYAYQLLERLGKQIKRNTIANRSPVRYQQVSTLTRRNEQGD